MFGYTGLGYDFNSGLTYARARYYQPELGRFISEDTYKGSLWNPKTQNEYAYVGNNPLLYIDPTGHYWTVDLALPLTQDDKDIIAAAEKDYAGATDDKGRASAHQRAMDVRNKYISMKNLKDAVDHLKYEGIINNNLDIVAEVCSPITSSELIYAYAGTLISSNSDKYIQTFGGGNTIEEGLEQFYGDIVCFTEDTLISTKDGQKPIKDIRVGDEVYSENVATGEKGLKHVKQVYINKSSSIVHIFIGKEEIKATPTHPFWVVGKGWIKAGDLKEGDKVLLYSGTVVTLTSVQLEKLEKPIKTYNFEVEDWHTYFVSNSQILVHNKCGDNPLGQTGSYVITFKSGMQYVGKGSYYRALTSEKRLLKQNPDETVDSLDWEWAKNSRAAFKEEYIKMEERDFGKPNARLFNQIQSPGAKYYEEDAGNEGEEE